MLPLLLNMHNTVCFQQAVWGCRYASKSKFHIVTSCSSESHYCHIGNYISICFVTTVKSERKKTVAIFVQAEKTHNRLCRCGMIFDTLEAHQVTVTSMHRDSPPLSWCRNMWMQNEDWVKHDEPELSYCAHSMKASTSLMHSINQPFSVQIKTQSQPHPAQNETLLALHSTQFTVNCALQTLVNHLCGIHLIFLPKMYMNINVHAIKPATKIPQTDAASSVVNTARWSNLLIWLCAGFSLISLHCLHQLWKASEGSRWTITIIKHRKSPRVYKYRPLQSFTKHHSNHQHYFWM